MASKVNWRRSGWLALGIAAIALAANSATAADPVKVGVVKNAVYGPLFIAEAKGYFTAENLASELVFFEGAAAMAPAVVAGSIDTSPRGQCRCRDLQSCGPGRAAHRCWLCRGCPLKSFQLFAIAASKRAYETGLKSYRGVPRHSVAIATFGSAPSFFDQPYREIPSRSGKHSAGHATGHFQYGRLHLVGGTADVYVGPVTLNRTRAQSRRRKNSSATAAKRGSGNWLRFTPPPGLRKSRAISSISASCARTARVEDYGDSFVDADGKLAGDEARARPREPR